MSLKNSKDTLPHDKKPAKNPSLIETLNRADF